MHTHVRVEIVPLDCGTHGARGGGADSIQGYGYRHTNGAGAAAAAAVAAASRRVTIHEQLSNKTETQSSAITAAIIPDQTSRVSAAWRFAVVGRACV